MDIRLNTLLGTLFTLCVCSCALADAYDDDSAWLDALLASARTKQDLKARTWPSYQPQYIWSRDINQRLQILEDLIFNGGDSKLLRRRVKSPYALNTRFLPSLIQRSWIEDDGSNRATETTPTVVTTTSTTPPTSTTSTTTPPTSTTTHTSTTSTTTEASRGGSQNTIPPYIPKKPSWWPNSWRWPWGRRRRSALVSSRNY